jgi:hypothetical protein
MPPGQDSSKDEKNVGTGNFCAEKPLRGPSKKIIYKSGRRGRILFETDFAPSP